MTNPADAPIEYIARTRAYYRALGYRRDYVWAHFEEVPFAPLTKPLAEIRLAVVTTAALPGPWDADTLPPKEVWSAETANPPKALYTNHVAWDKESTHTKDRESYLPLGALAGLVHDGVLGGLAPRVHGIPTEYSHRKTLDVDAPELLRRCREDGADAALFSPL